MATNFPTSLDTLVNPTATDSVATVSHADQHANANDAIEALEAKVGVNSSAVTTTHDYKLQGVTGGDTAASIAGAETLTNKTLTSPKVGTAVTDTNGNEIIETPATTSAVNHVKITNAITTEDALIEAAGDDTNVGLKIKGKGTSKVKLGDAELQVPDTDGASGQSITTNGSGVLGWSSNTVPTVGTTDTATLSLTTSGSQTVIVWAKATRNSGGLGGTQTATLLYNGVTKDTVSTPDVSGAKYSVSLQYSEIPAAGTHDITIATSAGSLSNIKITYMLIG